MKIPIRQLLASAVGAVAAAAIASLLGVKGTIVGAALGSVAATVGAALVAESIERGHQAVQQVAVRAPDSSLLRRMGGTGSTGVVTDTAPESETPVTEGVTSTKAKGDSGTVTRITSSSGPPARPRARVSRATPIRINWRNVAISTVIVFVIALVIITVLELIAGQPLSALTGGSSGGNGTSIFGGSTATTVPKPPSTTTTTVPTTSTTSTNAGATTTTTGASTTTTTTTTVPKASTTLPGAGGTPSGVTTTLPR